MKEEQKPYHNDPGMTVLEKVIQNLKESDRRKYSKKRG
jgi:hypothetical protein